jgi:hypothetical protein
MHVIYLVFGPNSANHTQAYFSILSFLRQPAALTGITVVTDQPSFYTRLAKQIQVLPVNTALLREWEGPHKFFWRVKIKALEAVAQRVPGQSLLYLDSDTFLSGSVHTLAATLADNIALMHEPEGAIATLSSKTERLTWRQLRGRELAGFTVSDAQVMWNAGVVGVPAARATAAIALALQLCDAWCAAEVTPRLIEQLALSVALSETGSLASARASIGHYWSAKPEWQAAISSFLLTSFLYARSVTEEITALSDFDFRAQPVKQRLKSTRGRVEKLAAKLFPNQDQQFIE